MSYKITITNETDNSVVFDGVATNDPTVNVDTGNTVYETDEATVSINAKESAETQSTVETEI